MTYSETNQACTTKAIAIGERKLIDEHATPHLISTLQWNTMNCNRSVGEFFRSNLVQENGRCDWSWFAYEDAAERVKYRWSLGCLQSQRYAFRRTLFLFLHMAHKYYIQFPLVRYHRADPDILASDQ